MPLGEARRFANRDQFTTGATLGIQNHSLQSLGNTISTIAYSVFTQRPGSSPVNGGGHRVKRRRPSYGLRLSCAPCRRCQSYVRCHRRRSYVRQRCSSVRTFAAQIGNAALEPSIAVPKPSTVVLERNIAAPEPGCVAHPGSVATAPRLRDLRSAVPCCGYPGSPIGSRTSASSLIRIGSSFPQWPGGPN